MDRDAATGLEPGRGSHRHMDRRRQHVRELVELQGSLMAEGRFGSAGLESVELIPGTRHVLPKPISAKERSVEQALSLTTDQGAATDAGDFCLRCGEVAVLLPGEFE